MRIRVFLGKFQFSDTVTKKDEELTLQEMKKLLDDSDGATTVHSEVLSREELDSLMDRSDLYEQMAGRTTK